MKEHTIYLRLIPCGKFAKLGKYFRKSTRCLQFEISLTEKNVIRYDTLQAVKLPVLSICASPRKGRYGDQCIERIVELYRDRVPELELASFDRLVRIWREYHLNDLTAGTQVQELALKEWKKQNKYDYSLLSIFMEHVALNYVQHDVVMSDGSIGTILMINKNDIARPLIQIGNFFVDLSTQNRLSIKKIL